jgi:hypothetical protein
MSQVFRYFVVPRRAVAWGPVGEFVAEQYRAVGAYESAADDAGAARSAAEQLTSEGTLVQFVRSIFVPEDETCIHLFRAESVDAVRAVAARASPAVERIAEAVSDSGAAP